MRFIDQSTSRWWVSCRREANSTGLWPWVRILDEHSVACGLSPEPTLAWIDHNTAHRDVEPAFVYNSNSHQITVFSHDHDYSCWLLNERRWPSCHQTMINDQPQTLNVHAGDTIIITSRDDLHQAKIDKNGRQAVQSLRAFCNEPLAATTLLEIR